MANETKVYRGSVVTLEANGAAIANNDVGVANDSTYSRATNSLDYPDAEFVLTATFSVAPVENSVIVLYAQPLDLAGGVADAEAPESGVATFKGEYIGRFLVNNVTTLQTMRCFARNVPDLAQYYIHNSATGQSIAAGWTLKVAGRTLGPV